MKTVLLTDQRTLHRLELIICAFLKPVFNAKGTPCIFLPFGVCSTKTNYTPTRRAASADEDTIVDGTEGGESPMGILNGERDAIIILSDAGVFKISKNYSLLQ